MRTGNPAAALFYHRDLNRRAYFIKAQLVSFTGAGFKSKRSATSNGPSPPLESEDHRACRNAILTRRQNLKWCFKAEEPSIAAIIFRANQAPACEGFFYRHDDVGKPGFSDDNPRSARIDGASGDKQGHTYRG